MKDDVLKVKSLHVLQRLLAPLVALRVSRLRRRRRLHSQHHLAPSAEVVKANALFTKWPTAALQSWLASGKVEAHARGTTIAFAREPRRAADVFWLISGKLVQVPNKAELRTCAAELVHLPQNVPKTGPLILPSHFVDDDARKALPPLTTAQESLADSLYLFHAGQLVDAERLILGGERVRGLRCCGDVVVLRLSFATCWQEIQTLPAVARGATIDAARACVERSLACFPGPPAAVSLMSANPVLAALPVAALKAIQLQLKPFVFLKGDAICGNVFEAEWVYFLTCGQVRIEDNNNKATARVVARPFAAIGLDAFVQLDIPDYFDQKARATAAKYCEMWGLPITTMLTVCDATSRLPCNAAATQLLRAQGWSHLPIAASLRACPCFATVSESALVAVARALHLRVYAPGETIAAANRIPACGFLIVAGNVHLCPSITHEARQLAPGQAHFFCEALMKMSVRDAVTSVTSALVLQGTPGLLLEAMESSGVGTEELQVLLTAAQDYVDRVYGVGQSEISRAQYAAAERVRLYKRREAEAVAHSRAAALHSASATPTEVLENQLLASLEVQLQALHPDISDAAKFEYFRGGRAGVEDAAVAPPRRPRRSDAFYTLDAQGNLITCDGGGGEDDASPAARALAPVRAPAPAPPAIVAVARASSSALTPPPSVPLLEAGERRAPPAPNSAPPASSSALRTAVRPPPPRRTASRQIPSPRIAALRATASRMKDEADGVDRRREYRQHAAAAAHHTPR